MTDNASKSSEQTYRQDQRHPGEQDAAPDNRAEHAAGTQGVGAMQEQTGSAPIGKGPAPYSLRDEDTALDEDEKQSDSGA